MKKLLIVLCVLMLALTALSSALAAQGDANLLVNTDNESNDSVSAGCVIGDTLYLQGYQAVYAWKAGEADATAYKYDLDIYDTDDGMMTSAYVKNVFGDGEKLYALLNVTRYSIEDNSQSTLSLEIREITLQDGVATFGEATNVDTSDLEVKSSYGNYISSFNSCVVMGDTVYATFFDDEGYMKLYAFKLDGSAIGYIDDIEDPYIITPYKDGQLLAECYSYENGTAFYTYDPESESVTMLVDSGTIDDVLYGIVYSTESDRLFYQDNGYIMAATDFDFANAQQVGQLSTTYQTQMPALLMAGDFYVNVAYDATCVRNTDPTALPSEMIKVSSAGYSQDIISAYYSFGNTHPDTGVLVTGSEMTSEEIIQAMLNRDSDVDIFELNVNSQAYDSLFNRGYIAELNSSETLTTAVEGMYSGARAVLEKDGKVLAIPTAIYSSTLGYNPNILEKLGIDEMPDNWEDFLELLKNLAQQNAEDNAFVLFNDSSMTVSNAKYTIIEKIWHSYAAGAEKKGESVGNDTTQLRALMETALSIDYEALGCQPDEELTEDGTSVYGGSVAIYDSDDESNWLLESYSGCSLGNMNDYCKPLLLSVVKGEDAPLAVEMTVAFINPYTKHMDEALAFMEEIYAQMPATVKYNLYDDMNEPKHYAGYESNKQETEKEIAEIDAKLETADEVDKPVLEQSKQDLQTSWENYEKYSWEISADQISWYRDNADKLVVKGYNYLESSGEDDNIYTLLNKLTSGEITLDDVLQQIEHTARMMALEGN